MDIHNEFIAQEKALTFYSGKAILNKRHAFYDICGEPWDFSAAVGFSFQIWEEREGGIKVIDWASDDNITYTSPNEIILNSNADETSIERGKYYYEISYILAGGYSVLIAYGDATFL
jgi:hypothetical protein